MDIDLPPESDGQDSSAMSDELADPKPSPIHNAIDYLLTHNWLIVVIIFIIAAAIVFGSGLNLKQSQQNSSCLATSSFLCYAPVYNHTTGYVTLTIGQDTNIYWATANIYFIPQNATFYNGIPVDISIPAPPGTYVITSGVPSRQPVSVSLLVSSPTKISAFRDGYIWAEYTLNGSSQQYYTQIGQVDLRAI